MFSTERGFARHTKWTHKKFSCEICCCQFTHVDSLVAHMNRAHKQKNSYDLATRYADGIVNTVLPPHNVDAEQIEQYQKGFKCDHKGFTEALGKQDQPYYFEWNNAINTPSTRHTADPLGIFTEVCQEIEETGETTRYPQTFNSEPETPLQSTGMAGSGVQAPCYIADAADYEAFSFLPDTGLAERWHSLGGPAGHLFQGQSPQQISAAEFSDGGYNLDQLSLGQVNLDDSQTFSAFLESGLQPEYD